MSISTSHKLELPRSVALVVFLALVGLALLDNGVYLVICSVTLILLLYFLWRTNRPGIVVFGLVSQWIQVVTFVIWMNVAGKDINFLSKNAGTAVICSCVGLLVMGLTFSWGIGSLSIPSREEFAADAKKIRPRKILLLYLYSTLFISSAALAVGSSSGFAQVLTALSYIKWVFFLMYGYVCFVNKKGGVIFVLIVVFEFVTSLYAYFSSFKEVFLMAIILSLTFFRKVSGRQILYSLMAAVFLFSLLITWTAIKSDYRKYLNGGSGQQVVEVSRGEALGNITEQVSELTWEKYQIAFSLFLYRIQYVFHLAVVMGRVPDVMPYENGQVWLDNISFVLVPRLLNPDKPIYQATVKTNKYTGFHYSGYKQGTSFSLGYFADSYVDFGYWGMFFPLAMLGLFVTLIYRTLFKLSQLNLLIRYGLINVALYEFTSFEADGLFLFGRLLTPFLVFWLLGKWVFPRVQNWLYK